MFAISVRVSPCSARCSPRSVGRVTISSPFDCSTVIAGETRSSSSPRGPLTRTTPGSIETWTPAGTGMGCFPIRLIDRRLVDVGHELAAHAGTARLVPGHHAARGRDDRGAHPAEHPRYLVAADVGAAARARHSLEPGYHGPAVVSVLEVDVQRLPHPSRLGPVARDVALLGEDAGDLRLEARRR